ncbi:hypothetical protein PHSY_000590 [Pseudozyma hubeiensis SY62]|uniref:RecQ-mediated genome instability protein 1 n=1 Tax=Pseudozyma hubeiensis (strain SY62) TaxID=1305764 RepID=R9NWU8_PSEHS|nr:hypothetical protein PHSY_000590 [Pseudozyma hubeiensis SY62]GAC93029.1 hypothetical protein PHSY_000590 [Pseudozyma hubeiensis SY62]
MTDHEQVPAAVTRLLAARYPTLGIDPSWLSNCVRDIRQRGSALSGPDQLARSVRQELLESDLSDVVAASYGRLTTEALGSSSGKIGDSGRGAILVQIESMIDIGYSASSQLEIAEARREARRANVDPNDVPAEAKAAADSDHMADFQAQEDDKIQTTTVYPRRMLKLELSDGSKSGKVSAVELQRVSDLDMNTTRIGAKLLLKGASIMDGCLMITPQTVSLEGGYAPEKHRVAEDKFIDKLRAQLGKAPQSHTQANGAHSTATLTSNGVGNPHQNANAVERGFSPDDDESELLAALEAEEEMMVAAATSSKGGLASTETKPASSSNNVQKPSSSAALASANQAAAVAAGRQRATLILPEGMTQASAETPRSQRSDAPPRASATQQDPILLIDSDGDENDDDDDDDDDDDEEFLVALPDALLSGADEAVEHEQKRPRPEPNRLGATSSAALSNSREQPIVIGSSPEAER